MEGAASKTVWASPVASWVKNACDAGDTGDLGPTPGAGSSPGEGNGSLLLYFCLKNPMDRGVWWATVRKGGKEPDATRCTQKTVHPLPGEILDCTGEKVTLAPRGLQPSGCHRAARVIALCHTASFE